MKKLKGRKKENKNSDGPSLLRYDQHWAAPAFKNARRIATEPCTHKKKNLSLQEPSPPFLYFPRYIFMNYFLFRLTSLMSSKQNSNFSRKRKTIQPKEASSEGQPSDQTSITCHYIWSKQYNPGANEEPCTQNYRGKPKWSVRKEQRLSPLSYILLFSSSRFSFFPLSFPTCNFEFGFKSEHIST